MHSLLQSDLGAQLPLHISLSRSLNLRTEQRQPFLDTLEKAISDSSVRPFEVRVKDTNWVANFEGIRWFLILDLSQPANNELNSLLQLSNRVAASFGQPPLYDEPHSRTAKKNRTQAYGVESESEETPESQYVSSKFHISIAWTLNAPSQNMKEETHSADLTALRNAPVTFTSVKAKIGNSVSSLYLSTRINEKDNFCGPS